MQVRRAGAVVLTLLPPLLAVAINPAALLGFGSNSNSTDPTGLLYSRLILGGCLVGGIGLIRGWRWAPLFCLSIALSTLLGTVPTLDTRPASLMSPSLVASVSWAGALAFFLHGTARPMTAARWSLVANGAVLWIFATLLAEPGKGGCFSGPPLDTSVPAYWLAVASTLVLAVGLALLSAGKTAGVLVTVVASCAVPLFVALSLDSSLGLQRAWVAFLAMPGIVTAAVGLAGWARPTFTATDG